MSARTTVFDRAVIPPRRARAVAAVCAAAAVAALCGSLAATSNGKAIAAAAAPSSFTVGSFTSFGTLDPDQGLSQPQLQVMNFFGEGLTRFNPDGAHIAGGLASGWKISSNHTTYTFTLRKGLKFSNGAPLHASDIVATYQREMQDKANQNIGEIVNFKSWSAPNNQTVVLQLKAPQESALSLLADPEIGPVFPAGDLTAANFFLKPISTGQYRVTAFDPATGNTTLQANPYYSGPQPSIPTIKFVYVADAPTRILQLQSGQIQYAENLDPDTLSELSGSTVGTLTKVYGGLYLDVNDRTGPLANVNVRKAISEAINRTELNRLVFNNKDSVMTSFWPTTMTGGNQKVDPPFNVAKAKALLVGTPCASGCSITVMVRAGTSTFQSFASIIQQNLQQIGISTSLTLTEPAVANQNAISGNFELYTGGLYDYANRVDVMLSYGLEYNGGIYSLYSGYNSPKMQSLANAALTSSGAAHVAAIDKIGTLFASDMPYIPLLDDVFANGQAKSTLGWATYEPTTFFSIKAK